MIKMNNKHLFTFVIYFDESFHPGLDDKFVIDGWTSIMGNKCIQQNYLRPG